MRARLGLRERQAWPVRSVRDGGSWKLVLSGLQSSDCSLDTSLFKPTPATSTTLTTWRARLAPTRPRQLVALRDCLLPAACYLFSLGRMDLPFASVGMTARWLVLVVAAFAGFVMWMRDADILRRIPSCSLVLCCGSSRISASFADAPTSLLKVLSLFLLFLYGATGARLAIFGRETKFVKGLLIGCELVVYASAAAYLGAGLPYGGTRTHLGP
jgi:hypothetical protein